MNPFKSQTISQKFRFGLIAIIGFIMLTFSTALVLVNFRTGEQKLSLAFDGILHKTSVSLPSALWKFNHDYVNDYIDSVFINEDMVYARVKSDSKIIKERFRTGFIEQDLNGIKNKKQYITKEQKIAFQDYEVGEVFLVMSKKRIHTQMIKESLVVIVIGFINIIGIFITTYYLSKQYIFKPLKALERSVNEISKGNLAAPIATTSKDEIGKLANAFKQMMINLQATMASKAELEKVIEERIAAEEHSSMLAGILEESMNEIYVFNAETLNFVMVNEGAKLNIGYTMEELETMTPMDIKPEYTKEKFSKMVVPLLEGTQKSLQFTAVHQRKNKTLYPVEVYLQLMNFQKGSVFVAIILDITERKAAREKLLASVKEKEVLLREIHHRVKNNMQIIQSLLSLQMGKFTDEELKKTLQDSNNRIKSMALIHETLYRSDDLANLNIKDYVEQITRYLGKIYIKPDQPIDIDIDIKPFSLGLDASIACGLIINELITNALKYAFPDNTQGMVRISFHKQETGEAVLMVSDNGRGLPEDIQIETVSTLGLRIVKMLAEDQLDGILKVDRNAVLTFYIEFPIEGGDE